jgi:hypothetical protein
VCAQRNCLVPLDVQDFSLEVRVNSASHHRQSSKLKSQA